MLCDTLHEKQVALKSVPISQSPESLSVEDKNGSDSNSQTKSNTPAFDSILGNLLQYKIIMMIIAL